MGSKRKKRNRSVLALVVFAMGVVGYLARRKRLQRSVSTTSRSPKQLKRTPLHHHLIDYFIPHERNSYKPKVFEKRSTTHLMLAIVAVKVAILAVLVAVYPNLARLDSNVQAEMYDLIGNYRSEKNAGALTVNTYLEQAALAKANDMLASNYFSHYGVDGKKPWEWLDPAQYAFAAMGENLAMDFLTAGAVFKAFKESPSHDRNLIQKNYSEVGIAIVNGYLDGHNTNVMVVFFASPKTIRQAVAEAAPLPQAPVTAPQAPSTLPQNIKQPPSTLGTTNQNTNTTPPPPAAGVAQNEPAEAEPLSEQPVESISQMNPESARTILIEKMADAQDIEVLGAESERYVFAENFNAGAVFSQGDLTQRAVAWADRFLIGVLIALILLLLVNIIVKIEVQHTSVIANAVMLIVVAAGALYVNVHQAEALGEYVKILAASIL